MQPVVSLQEMKTADDVAVALVGHETLVQRAGAAVAEFAIELLGDPESSRVVVLCGPGSNGQDGQVAASLLRDAGCEVEERTAIIENEVVSEADLVIDALFGTGLSRACVVPDIAPGIPVLSVDIASGISSDTGQIQGRALMADYTLAMQSLKSGHLLGLGPDYAGAVRVADIGITVQASMALLEADDRFLIPVRNRNEHKWSVALGIVAGSDGMEGAAVLCASAAQRSGAGMVRLLSLASPGSTSWPLEAVRRHVDAGELASSMNEFDRCHAVVLGPGLGRSEVTAAAIRDIVAQRQAPLLLDADGLAAFETVEQLGQAVAEGGAAVVLTPHEGEAQRLLGTTLPDDRVGLVRTLATKTGAVVLLKGPTTVIASPDAIEGIDVLFMDAGGPALATAGSGDVLAGIIGALLARGCPALYAAGLGSLIHALASQNAPSTLIASDLPYLVGEIMNEVLHGS